MIHSRTLRERFYGREIYISLNKNDKNVISRINCVTGSVGTLSRSRLDYTLAVDERFTLNTRGWSGIEYLCWTRKSPVPKIKTWSLLCICLILNRLQSLNLHFLIKKWELYYLSHKMVKRITWVTKCKVFSTGLLLLLLSLFFLMLLTKPVVTEPTHFILTSSQIWIAAFVLLLWDWNVSRNL